MQTITITIYIYNNVCMCVYLTFQHKQNVTQGQFLKFSLS